MKLFANMLFMIYSLKRINELIPKKEKEETIVEPVKTISKPKEKAKDNIIKEHRFLMGGLYYSGNEKFVYMCNIKGNDYGVFLNNNTKGMPKIKRIGNKDYYSENIFLKEESFASLIDYLYTNKKNRWIIDYMFKETYVDGYA